MSANTVNNQLYLAQAVIADPGNAKSISVDKSLAVCNLVSAAAETRTLPRPVRAGVVIDIHMKTDGGDITLTVTGGYDEAATTDFVFSDAGQFITLKSFFDGTNYYWRKISDYAMAGLTPADAAILASFGDLTASVPELNSAVGDGDEVVVTTRPILAADNGKTFYLSLAAGFTSTLPAPALGLRYRFIVKTAPTGAPYIITTTASANIMFGMMLERAGGAGVAGAARDTFNFIHAQAIVGDWVEFYSDGTNWYYHGMTDVAAGSTVAAT